jgi:hypothetical protein
MYHCFQRICYICDFEHTLGNDSSTFKCGFLNAPLVIDWYKFLVIPDLVTITLDPRFSNVGPFYSLWGVSTGSFSPQNSLKSVKIESAAK